MLAIVRLQNSALLRGRKAGQDVKDVVHVDGAEIVDALAQLALAADLKADGAFIAAKAE